MFSRFWGLYQEISRAGLYVEHRDWIFCLGPTVSLMVFVEDSVSQASSVGQCRI